MDCSTGSVLIGLLGAAQYADSCCLSLHELVCIVRSIRQPFFLESDGSLLETEAFSKSLVIPSPLIFLLTCQAWEPIPH